MASWLPRFLRRTGKLAALTGVLYVADDKLNYSSATRSIRTLWTGLLITLDYKLNWTKDAGPHLLEIHARAGQRILDTCKANGGLYIKLGQGIASQNHVLPPQINERFRELYDEAPAEPFSVVRKLIREEFGREPEELFASFEPEAIASASIAQVHRATLKDGTPVAVKVQKPAVRWQMGWDLLCYRIICAAFEFAFDLPIYWSVDFTADHLKRETDFTIEGRSSERALAELRKEPSLRNDVYVPTVHWDLTTKRIMTAEWIDGVSLAKVKEVSKQFDKHWVVQKVIEVFSHQIFHSGFVHADPHPGNLMVLRQNGRPQLVLLDHGLYVQETPSFVRSYAEFWRALLLADIPTLEAICHSWGIRDVKMMSSATLQRPYDPEKALKAGKSALEKPTFAEIYELQMEAKDRAKEMLGDTSKVPLEIIFVARNMNLIRSVNKSYGSPVDRVGEMARWAVSSFSRPSLPSVWLGADANRASPGIRDYFSSLVTYIRFNAALFAVSLGFTATKVWAWIQGNILRRDKVLDYEEVLDQQAKEAMRQQFGMVLDDNAFDA
ncbi:ABC1 family-domain-containing protein [Hyaloraphidium curvatum]|nr:ABC1 family-domain-containing protein [Hyaloraphidium curvatum]